MGTLNFKQATFVKTAMLAKDYPPVAEYVEIAVAGSSNVGKSSLLNHLFQRKGLVKTSSTPGKTQGLNFFEVDASVRFVDLPGYGYAKVPLEVRAAWGPMVQTYLEKRESLVGLLLLSDLRRGLSNQDRQLLAWARHKSVPVILVLTKTDKLNQSERLKQTKVILSEWGEAPCVPYSIRRASARDQLIKAMEALFLG